MNPTQHPAKHLKENIARVIIESNNRINTFSYIKEQLRSKDLLVGHKHALHMQTDRGNGNLMRFIRSAIPKRTQIPMFIILDQQENDSEDPANNPVAKPDKSIILTQHLLDAIFVIIDELKVEEQSSELNVGSTITNNHKISIKNLLSRLSRYFNIPERKQIPLMDLLRILINIQHENLSVIVTVVNDETIVLSKTLDDATVEKLIINLIQDPLNNNLTSMSLNDSLKLLLNDKGKVMQQSTGNVASYSGSSSEQPEGFVDPTLYNGMPITVTPNVLPPPGAYDPNVNQYMPGMPSSFLVDPNMPPGMLPAGSGVPGMFQPFPANPGMPGMPSSFPIDPTMPPGMFSSFPANPSMPSMLLQFPANPSMPGMFQQFPANPCMPDMFSHAPANQHIPEMFLQGYNEHTEQSYEEVYGAQSTSVAIKTTSSATPFQLIPQSTDFNFDKSSIEKFMDLLEEDAGVIIEELEKHLKVKIANYLKQQTVSHASNNEQYLAIQLMQIENADDRKEVIKILRAMYEIFIQKSQIIICLKEVYDSIPEEQCNQDNAEQTLIRMLDLINKYPRFFKFRLSENNIAGTQICFKEVDTNGYLQSILYIEELYDIMQVRMVNASSCGSCHAEEDFLRGMEWLTALKDNLIAEMIRSRCIKTIKTIFQFGFQKERKPTQLIMFEKLNQHMQDYGVFLYGAHFPKPKEIISWIKGIRSDAEQCISIASKPSGKDKTIQEAAGVSLKNQEDYSFFDIKVDFLVEAVFCVRAPLVEALHHSLESDYDPKNASILSSSSDEHKDNSYSANSLVMLSATGQRAGNHTTPLVVNSNVLPWSAVKGRFKDVDSIVEQHTLEHFEEDLQRKFKLYLREESKNKNENNDEYLVEKLEEIVREERAVVKNLLIEIYYNITEYQKVAMYVTKLHEVMQENHGYSGDQTTMVEIIKKHKELFAVEYTTNGIARRVYPKEIEDNAHLKLLRDLEYFHTNLEEKFFLKYVLDCLNISSNNTITMSQLSKFIESTGVVKSKKYASFNFLVPFFQQDINSQYFLVKKCFIGPDGEQNDYTITFQVGVDQLSIQERAEQISRHSTKELLELREFVKNKMVSVIQQMLLYRLIHGIQRVFQKSEKREIYLSSSLQTSMKKWISSVKDTKPSSVVSTLVTKGVASYTETDDYCPIRIGCNRGGQAISIQLVVGTLEECVLLKRETILSRLEGVFPSSFLGKSNRQPEASRTELLNRSAIISTSRLAGEHTQPSASSSYRVEPRM